MPEALTESFCERCGTRYEFPAPARLGTLRKTRGLVSGVKNYIMSQDALSDTISDAMRTEEEALAAHQLESFHSAFSFCIDCRQYACTNCWNDSAGRCRSCVPIPGVDDVGDRMEAVHLADHRALHGGAVADATGLGEMSRLGADAWPESDVAEAATAANGDAPIEWPDETVPEPFEAEAPTEPIAYDSAGPPESLPTMAELEPELGEAELAPRPVLSWEADVPNIMAAEIEETPSEPEPEFADATPKPGAEPVFAEAIPEPEREPVLAEAEPVFEAILEPAPEPVLAEAEPVFAEAIPEPEPEPVFAEAVPEPQPELVLAEAEPVFAEAIPEPEPEPVLAEAEPVFAEAVPEPEPEPVLADATPKPGAEPVFAEAIPEPEPEPVFAEAVPEPRRITPISETIIHLPRSEPIAARADEAQPIEDEALAARRSQLDVLGIDDPGIGKVGPARNVLPYRSSGAGMSPSELVQRTVGKTSTLWDASAREVASARSAVAVQNCGTCGLSLSASARFCRRCGTQQARSA